METILKELISENDPMTTSMLNIVVSRRISENFRLSDLDERKFSCLIYALILDYFENHGIEMDGILRFIEIMHKTAKAQLEERGMDV